MGTRTRILFLLALAAAILLPACSSMPTPSTTGRFEAREIRVADTVRRYQVFVPARSGTAKLPVILFLHGSGERGSDNQIQLDAGLGPYVRRHLADFPALVVFPQVEENGEWMGANVDMALAAMEAATKEFNGDARRTYLTGLSMGG